MRRRFALVALIAAMLAVALEAGGVLEQAELDSIDARFALRGSQPPSPDLALVLVDDVTFNDLDLQWPFPRGLHARVLDRLREDGARLIAYDVQFTQPASGCRPDVDPDARVCDGDAALLDAVERARPTVFAVSAADERGDTNLFGGGPIIDEVGARPGTVLLPPDRGSVLRRLVWGDAGVPSFATAAAEVLRRRSIASSAFPRAGEALIAYAGPPGTFPATSFSRVLRGRFARGTFRDKIVVVGTEDPSLKDLHAVPTSGEQVMPGAEVQANAIATVLADFPLRDVPGWVAVLLAGAFGALVPLLAGVLRFRIAMAFGLVVLVSWPLLVQWQFSEGRVLPLVVPFAGLVLGGLGTVGTQAMAESLARARTRASFERFVGVSVVDEVLRQAGGDARLGGRRMQGSVLFCDLRGFTTFAERVDPDEVIEVLNRYLTEMSDAVLDHGGTLVSYMGDGIMAVFGAPLAQDDHGDRALAAASDMTGPRLTRFNSWMAARGHDFVFRMGVGLSSGTVMSGMVGSERRMEYTALGDVTNIASRIESMTAAEGYAVLVTEATRHQLRSDHGDLVDLGERRVRGRSAPLHLWGLGEATPPGGGQPAA